MEQDLTFVGNAKFKPDDYWIRLYGRNTKSKYKSVMNLLCVCPYHSDVVQIANSLRKCTDYNEFWIDDANGMTMLSFKDEEKDDD